MITKLGRGENILEQQTFANQAKEESKLTSLKKISRSLYISRPKAVIERLSKYQRFFLRILYFLQYPL